MVLDLDDCLNWNMKKVVNKQEELNHFGNIVRDPNNLRDLLVIHITVFWFKDKDFKEHIL